MSESVVRGFKVERVKPDHASWVTLTPAYVLPANSADRFVAVSEPFLFPSYGSVFGWTEGTLHRMDKLGITFAAELHGPALLPSVEDASVLVPVWYSTGSNWNGGWKLIDEVVRIVDELMDGTLPDAALSYEDRCFLEAHYRSWRNNIPKHYRDAVRERLQEGVRESDV